MLEANGLTVVELQVMRRSELGGRLDDLHLALLRKLREAMTSPEIKQDLKDQTKSFVRRGVFGVPSLFYGSEMFFGKNSLPNLEIELSKHKKRHKSNTL